ncbi:hypothetical protein BP6252_06191 [Coleophoma cylindrospora]|uniref:C2H2-type domain-containing protein n=1 Tax=Coleophoma cylindrospora TaxID=1849047 RepID=A0A3D8RLX6_9HELO|nr:hypothetical protein BP6252_06191 [Coleophoma cylindrospora]
MFRDDKLQHLSLPGMEPTWNYGSLESQLQTLPYSVPPFFSGSELRLPFQHYNNDYNANQSTNSVNTGQAFQSSGNSQNSYASAPMPPPQYPVRNGQNTSHRTFSQREAQLSPRRRRQGAQADREGAGSPTAEEESGTKRQKLELHGFQQERVGLGGNTGPQSIADISNCCSSCSEGLPCDQEDCCEDDEVLIHCTRENCSQPCRVEPCFYADVPAEPEINASAWESDLWDSQVQDANQHAFTDDRPPIDPYLLSAISQEMQNQHYTANADATQPAGPGLPTPYSTGSLPSPTYQEQCQTPTGFDSMLSGTGGMFPGAFVDASKEDFQPLDNSCRWDQCDQSFSSQDALYNHFHTAHIDPFLQYSCPIPASQCPSIIGSHPLDHLQSYHGWNQNNCPDSSCQEMGPQFCDPSQLHNHFDQQHSIQPQEGLSCKWESCKIVVSDLNQLSEHLTNQHHFHIPVTTDEEIDLSPTSDMKASSEVKAPRVSILPNRAATEGEDPRHTITCKWKTGDNTICGVAKHGKEAAKELQEHVREAHLAQLSSKLGYICQWDGCGRAADPKLKDKGFSQRGKLERHMASHTTYKCCRCSECGMEFSAPQALKQHMHLHTGEKPWECKYCKKRFPQQSAKTIHERTHTGEKPLSCEVCGMTFSESSNLTKHRKTHGKKGIHLCPESDCNKSFHRFDQLKRHLEKHRRAAAKHKSSGVKQEADDDLSSLTTSEFDEKASVSL